MTTTRETCMCECEECLALRAAEADFGSGETVAAFEHDGSTYEIEHLGIDPGSRWADFAVYCDDEEVAGFAIAESMLRPESRPAGPQSRPAGAGAGAALPVGPDELVRLARQALSG
jgi:hypothetical protein